MVTQLLISLSAQFGLQCPADLLDLLLARKHSTYSLAKLSFAWGLAALF